MNQGNKGLKNFGATCYLNSAIQCLIHLDVLNPRNEDAIYSLARLKLDSSDYQKSKELNDKLMTLCDKFCNQSQKLKIEIENLSKK